MDTYRRRIGRKWSFFTLLWVLAGFLVWTIGDLRSVTAKGVLASAAPVITDVLPKSAVVGDTVTIYGENLGGTIEVKFNGISAQFFAGFGFDPNPPFIMAVVPQNAATGPITVTIGAGTVSTIEPFVIRQPMPVIESFLPTNGPPNTVVFIQGEDLKYTTAVLFNGQQSLWSIGIDPVNIGLIVRVPTNATTGPITVVGPNGNSTSEVSFTVTAPPSFTVQEWPLDVEAGMSLILRVNDNFWVKDVQLNGVSIPFIGFAPTDLIIMVPTNATSGLLTIFTPTETVSSPGPVTVHAKATIQSVSPASATVGAIVQLLGGNFQDVSDVRLGNSPVAFTRLNNETISFVVPAGTAGGFITIVTRFSIMNTQVEFAVITGQIITQPGTILGPVPNSDPKPVTAIRLSLVSPTADASSLLSPSSGVRSLKVTWVGEEIHSILETNEGLAPGNWRPVTITPGIHELVIPIDSTHRFFRLTARRGGAVTMQSNRE